MKEIDKLIAEIFEIKNKKSEVVKNQQYERAAALRDTERQLERKLYSLLYSCSEDDYDWKKFEEGLVLYFMQTYNIDYRSVDSYKQLIRILKLRDIGI